MKKVRRPMLHPIPIINAKKKEKIVQQVEKVSNDKQIQDNNNNLEKNNKIQKKK